MLLKSCLLECSTILSTTLVNTSILIIFVCSTSIKNASKFASPAEEYAATAVLLAPSEYLEKLSFLKKLLISYIVVDQGFAESNKFFKKNKSEQHLHYHLIGTGCTMWICWQVATLSGIILGSFVPAELGLKFTIPLTFIAIVVQDLKKIDHLIVMITCGLSSLLFFEKTKLHTWLPVSLNEVFCIVFIFQNLIVLSAVPPPEASTFC